MHNLHPGANLHPVCIFGHVNGILRICTRVQNVYFLYVSIGDFDILQTFSVYDFVLNDIKINLKSFLSK